MLIDFIKCDFPKSAPLVMSNFRGSMESFVRIHSFDLFLFQSWTALHILRYCVFKDKIKLFNFSKTFSVFLFHLFEL